MDQRDHPVKRELILDSLSIRTEVLRVVLAPVVGPFCWPPSDPAQVKLGVGSCRASEKLSSGASFPTCPNFLQFTTY